MSLALRPEAVLENAEIERAADAYVEAADGDMARALIWAVEDLIACEARYAVRLARAEAAVSRGFIRSALQCGEGG